jgi:heptaprenyl diphosphate synthase
MRRGTLCLPFSSGDLCVAGLIVMPSLLFNPSTPGRVAQFLLFWVFAALMGKKNNALMTFLVILGIVLFNLLVPYGRVLWQFGAFRITEGALTAGIHRAVTLEGLFMLSKASISGELRLPGTFGALIGESLRMFALITERKRRISRKNFIADIDALLLELEREGCTNADCFEEGGEADGGLGNDAGGEAKGRLGNGARGGRSTPTGYAVLAAATALSWGIFVLGIILF